MRQGLNVEGAILSLVFDSLAAKMPRLNYMQIQFTTTNWHHYRRMIFTER